MGTRRVELGSTGRTVSLNIARIRKDQRLTLRDLAGRLEKVGRRLAHTGISDIENGSRRIDVDDLLAIAAALDVSPVALLMPDTVNGSDEVTATGVGTTTARELWRWLTADSMGRPNAPRIHPDFDSINVDAWLRSRPEWLNAEELPGDDELTPKQERRIMRMMRDQIEDVLETRERRAHDRGND